MCFSWHVMWEQCVHGIVIYTRWETLQRESNKVWLCVHHDDKHVQISAKRCAHFRSWYVYMCCDLAGSARSREHWLWNTTRKGMHFFYCFENPSIAYNFGTTGPIQVGFSGNCNSPNEDFNQNWKYHMFDFRLIPLDCITYHDYKHVQVRAKRHSFWWLKKNKLESNDHPIFILFGCACNL